MTKPSTNQISELLVLWKEGNQTALDVLIPLVEPDLRRIARQYMRKERPGHTFQTTALVNEAYIKLVGQRGGNWQNRAHFFAIAATLMRRILIDHAKTRCRTKRGGGAIKVSLDDALAVSIERSEELIELNAALERLSGIDERKARIVEMKYFGGLSVEESAEVLGVSSNTVIRDWKLAKAWLRREISGDRDDT